MTTKKTARKPLKEVSLETALRLLGACKTVARRFRSVPSMARAWEIAASSDSANPPGWASNLRWLLSNLPGKALESAMTPVQIGTIKRLLRRDRNCGMRSADGRPWEPGDVGSHVECLNDYPVFMITPEFQLRALDIWLRATGKKLKRLPKRTPKRSAR